LGNRRISVVPSPAPHTKFSKINEMHEKGDRGGEMEVLLYYLGVREGDSGAEPDAVEISYLLRPLYVSN